MNPLHRYATLRIHLNFTRIHVDGSNGLMMAKVADFKSESWSALERISTVMNRKWIPSWQQI